ncbi:3-deoxy-D-manno-octulosonic acid transferase [Orrella marina]|uniref:3-deoxy-D-manno-octulosonic acid transferase n=1 Tax=Orrella marina TaxID=2163011 RepID=A0A2R4XLC7_9BURK|nr:3-deoxy-D-manno-octulosonic acid transferase [Orrella marina]
MFLEVAGLVVRLIYSIVLMLVAPLVWFGMGWRARKTEGDWGIFAAERFGCFPQPWDGRPPVWVHAVSVGEVRAAVPLIQSLLLKGDRVLLTHMTPTGRAEARRLLAREISDGQVRQQWIPYDFYGSMNRFLRHFSPRLVILIEREVWPNLVHAARVRRVPVILASARFSERSARQTRRINQIFGGLLRDTYSGLTKVLAQTPEDARRLFDAGAPDVSVCGNLKFDVTLPVVAVQGGQAWHERIARPTVVIASTREGEDARFVPLIAEQVRQPIEPAGVPPLFVLVPRHPERFDQAAGLLDSHRLRYVRWSMIRDDPAALDDVKEMEVILGDTMGELPFFYGASDAAIVGGSFEPHGGQNFIEASAIGVPVLVGPHTRNFRDAVISALQAQALVQVNDPEQALMQALQWLREPDQAHQIGMAGKSWVATHVGATARISEAIATLNPMDDQGF